MRGARVDASGAHVRFEDGNSGQLANGVRVEVEGSLTDGVLVARKVDLENDNDGDDDDDRFEVEGSISSIDTATKSLVVRGVTVTYSSDTRFTDGASEAGLAVGTRIEVEGDLEADGSGLVAQVIEFDD